MQTVDSSANTAPLLRRAYLFLEDGDWASANEYCEKVLDQNPECGEAYLGKLMAELRIRRRELLAEQKTTFDKNPNYQKALRFGDEKLKQELNAAISAIVRREKQNQIRAAQREAEARLAAEEESRGRFEEQTIATDKRKQLFKMVLLIAVPLLLIAILAAVILPGPVGIPTSNTAENSDFSFSILPDGTAEITKYTGTDINVTIPARIDGCAVTSIGDAAFDGCTSLQSITLPKSSISIGGAAFVNCPNLEYVWYAGSEADRAKIAIDKSNFELLYATWHYNSAG